ncbi:MAG: PQQ-binding-like beta-propeller repeat protein, partial [Phycisphaerae bacterium]
DLHLPAVQALAAGGRLFVKGAGPCAAFDLQSFAPLWKARPSVEGVAERLRRFQRQIIRRQRAGRSDRLSRQDRLRFDYVTASMSVYRDLVMTIEPSGSGETFDEDGITVRQPGRRQIAAGNRLVAYDVRTGSVRWQRGRTGIPDDPLGFVQFLAPPDPAEGLLWAPVIINGDLHLAVLDPATGDLRKTITLCTPLAGRMSSTAALWPVVAGGTVYLATGQGLLFAIGAADQAPRWAARYRRSRAVRRRSSFPDRTAWLPAPPVVSGPFVLLAPTDSDSLMAFDRVTGELRWVQQRHKNRYIVAADPEHLWLAGDGLACLSLGNGDVLWKTARLDATGRATLAGDRIYVPTATGLALFDTATGQRLAQHPLPGDEQPLGNLLALGDALISVDAYEVRKYPDVERSYQFAKSAHQSDPTAAGPAISLARLELIAHRPEQALAVLDQVEPDSTAARGILAHLQVEALLALAGQSEQADDVALTYVRRAVEAATSDRDSLRTGLALAQNLRNSGNFEEAYQQLWALADTPAAGLTLMSADQTQRQARSIIAQQIEALEETLPTPALADITSRIADQFESSVRRLDKARWTTSAARSLRRLAELGAPGGWGQAASIALANWQRSNGRFEPAEQDYMAAIRRNDHASHTARALAELARMYLQPQQFLPVEAKGLLDRLAREYGQVKFEWSQPDGTAGVQTGHQVAAELADRIDRGALSDHQWTLQPGAFHLLEESVWTHDLEDANTQLLTVLTDDCEAIADRILISVNERTLRSYRLSDGSLEWEADLRLPDEQVELELSTSQPPTSRPLHYAVADGQTALVRTADGLHAFGLVTGKRLWSKPQFEVEPRIHNMSPAGLIWAGQGRVACLPDRNRLAVLNMRDGSTMWSRQLDLPSVAQIRIADGFVVVTNYELTRASAFALDDGAPTATLTFEQDESMDRVVRPAQTQGLLCGPQGQAVVAYELATGQRRWGVDVPGELVRIFIPAPGRIGIGTLGGRLKLINARTGRVLLDQLLPGCRNGVVDGALDGQTLLVGGIIDRPAGRRPALVGLDVKTGQVRWERQDLAMYSRRPWYFDFARGVVPALVELSPQDDGQPSPKRRSNNRPVALVLIDAHTGQNIGPAFGKNEGGERLTGDLEMRAGCLAVGTSHAVRLIRIEPTAGARAQ